MNIDIKNLYYTSCLEELRVNKPGNFSIESKILGMNNKKFEYAAKISSEILSNTNLSLGESIYNASLKSFKELRSNYNLGIILLCAPIFKIKKSKLNNFVNELNKIINNISEKDGKLILSAIKAVGPGGINKYSGKGDVNTKINLSFNKIMKIGSKWDRISRCYNNNYKEIILSGLPFFISIKKKLSYNDSISLLFLNYLSLDYDSHLLRKYGIEKASKITKKASMIRKINNNKNLCIALKKFDKYLKFFNFNPGTCADLTVTTLLINKIRDIFKFRI